MITDNDLVSVAGRVADRIEQLDGELLELARRSQAQERATLTGGSFLPVRDARAIVCEPYATEAGGACARARDDIAGYVAALEGRAAGHTSDPATADEIASVTFALDRGNLTDGELTALYERYRDKWAIARVLRKEAAERRIFLEADPAETVMQYGAEARRRATDSVTDRWHDGSTAAVPVAVPANVIGRDLLSVLRGVDMFGGPLD